MANAYMIGAGASAAAPAQLPTFPALRAFLIASLGLTGEAEKAARRLPPERFMQSVQDGRLPLQEWLTKSLTSGRPNAVHHVLARALLAGEQVWTVNVDELIEDAVRAQMGSADGKPALAVTSYPDEVPDPRANLLKPHGTVGRGKYIFRSDQVIRPLPRTWADRLAADFTDKNVVVFGYAGWDADTRVALNDAFAAAAGVTWFAIEGDRDGVLQRFPSLATKCEFRGGGDIPTLTPAFIGWADEQGYTSHVSAPLRAMSSVGAESRQPAPLTGDERLAAALMLERVGEIALTRKALIDLFRWPPAPPAALLTALKRIRTIDFYNQARWTRPLFALAANQRYAAVLPPKLRARIDRAAVTTLSSRLGDHRAAEIRARHVAWPDDPAILVTQAKSARFTGRHLEAVTLATRAADTAERRGEIDILAHSIFETAFAATWAGRLDRATVAVDHLRAGIDGLAGTRWIAWGAWQKACLYLYANDPVHAVEELALAESLFRTDHLDSGIAAVLTVRLTAQRLGGATEREHSETVRQLERLRGTEGWTAYTDASVDLEYAEWARSHSMLNDAESRYEAVVDVSGDEPVHLCLALLGLAETARQRGDDNTEYRERVRSVLTRHPMGYIEAHLAITEYLAGRLSTSDALARIRSSMPGLSTRTGLAASTPHDYCLGTRAGVHELFLP